MRIKHIVPSLLILCLAGGIAASQTINKALQLSQDATGAFSVDSFNGVYFPGHILSPTGGSRASPSISGTGTPTIVGTDTAGLITMGTSATTATAVFGTTYLSVPWCLTVAQVASPLVLTSAIPATTSITITQSSTSSNKYNYWCSSNG